MGENTGLKQQGIRALKIQVWLSSSGSRGCCKKAMQLSRASLSIENSSMVVIFRTFHGEKDGKAVMMFTVCMMLQLQFEIVSVHL